MINIYSSSDKKKTNVLILIYLTKLDDQNFTHQIGFKILKDYIFGKLFSKHKSKNYCFKN